MNARGQALRIGDELEEPVQLIALFFTERGTKVLAVRTGRPADFNESFLTLLRNAQRVGAPVGQRDGNACRNGL